MGWRSPGGDMAGSEPMLEVTPIVYVVDDDVSVREALDGSLREAGWQPRVFASAREFLACPRAAAPSCLVLDVALPDLNGLDLQQQLATDRDQMPMTVRAMKAGAIEFLTKPFDDEALLASIRNAIERSAAARAHAAELRSLRERHASLSRREREVMALVLSGLLNKQVGGELGISEVTVKAHRGRVMRKMGASSLADLVNIGAMLGVPGRN